MWAWILPEIFMKNIKLLSALAAVGASFVAFEAHAGMVSDAHGNVGYDTAEECDAAVQSGQAKFYESFTHKPTLKRPGETSVQAAMIKDLGPQYRLGACDKGVGRRMGRDGVSKALQGKYIPFSPDMQVNVYLDASGKPTRASMQQCDNWFSGNAPRAVPLPPERAPEPAAEAAPAKNKPAAEKKAGARPYVFGTAGALRDGASVKRGNRRNKDRDTSAAGQVGAGVQFNEWLGGEVYYQGGDKQEYDAPENLGNEKVEVRNDTYGGRLTAGTKVAKKARVFAKAGVAGVRHKSKTAGAKDSDTKARATAGVGATVDVNDNWAVRADYDHYFKRNGDEDVKWKGADYLGVGAQYKF